MLQCQSTCRRIEVIKLRKDRPTQFKHTSMVVELNIEAGPPKQAYQRETEQVFARDCWVD